MSKITNNERNGIAASLKAYVTKQKTQATASRMLGISPATMSAIMNGRYEDISDEMWRNLAYRINHTEASWTLVRTGAFEDIELALTDGQEDRNVLWVIGEAGCGKTTAARAYEAAHAEVFYVLCAEDMKKGDFVREIARRVGCKTAGRNIRELWSDILETLVQMDAPLLIFDEADKLTESVFGYFISMYNRLEDHAGMVFLSTDYICRRISNGLRYEKKGYKEFFSRIGRKYFELDDTTATDVIAVCKANGISEESALRMVLEEVSACDYDLRRVKKSVKRTLKQGK